MLALLTKEVYSSLFVGILSGALIYSNGSLWGMVLSTFDTMIGKIRDSWNVGILIFIDDYFNCLTVGSVMRPVTDKYKISREKLAYIIDSTAAPVCIIAPISSWAAAVSSIALEGEGLSLFIRSIPYNLYALLTLLSVIVMSVMGLDYGRMRKVELAAAAEKREESRIRTDPGHGAGSTAAHRRADRLLRDHHDLHRRLLRRRQRLLSQFLIRLRRV